MDYLLSQVLDAFGNAEINETIRIKGLKEIHKIVKEMKSFG
jgi:hypothetical protein